MNKLTSLAVATATALSVSAPAQAATIAEHEPLWNAIHAAGVTIYLNEDYCNQRSNVAGLYASQERKMLICQQNRYVNSRQQVQWTEYDLDTLRHEAHHLVQDCLGNGSGNGNLISMYQYPYSYAQNYFSHSQSNAIVNSYKSKGLDNRLALVELEAFAVAADNDPLEQVEDIVDYCL